MNIKKIIYVTQTTIFSGPNEKQHLGSRARQHLSFEGRCQQVGHSTIFALAGNSKINDLTNDGADYLKLEARIYLIASIWVNIFDIIS